MFNIAALIANIADSVGQQVGAALSGVVGEISNAVNKYVITPVSTDVSNVLSSVSASVDALERNAGQAVSSTIATVGSALTTAEQNTATGFQSALSAVGSTISKTEQIVIDSLNQAVAGVEQGFQQIVSGVGGAISSLAGQIEAGIEKVGETLAAAIMPVLKQFSDFVEQLPQDAVTVAKDIREGIDAVGKGVADAAAGIAKLAANAERKAASDIALALDPKTWVGPKQLFGSVFFDAIAEITGLDLSKADPLALSRFAGGMAAQYLLASADFLDPATWYLLGNQLPQIFELGLRGSYRDIEQIANAGVPNVLLKQSELVTALYRGEIDQAYFQDQMERHGISDNNSKVLYKIGAAVLGGSELVELYRRGTIASYDDLIARAYVAQVPKEVVDGVNALYDELVGVGEQIEFYRRKVLPDGWKDFFDDARRNGFTEERIAALKKISFKIPSPFEQKRFTIRKVDDPATVQKFGYDFGLNQAYLDAAFANGYDEATAKRLYRDSWVVPPFFITEGLYKTGLLDKDTFTQLLEIEGFAPYFIDKFAEQLKPKLTLADVKDMYKYQVITADEIPSTLEEIGITGDLATKYSTLWQASVKLASPLDQTGAGADAAQIKGDTKSLIIEGYKDHILNKDTATAKLKEIGESDETATLTLEIADYQLTQQTIKDTFTLVNDQYLAGQISETDALQALIDAGSSHEQVVVYQDKLEKAGRSKPKVPTLAEFGAWFKKGIITSSELAAGISLLGYSATWVPFYLAYYGVDPQTISSLGFSLSVPTLS